MKQLFYLCTGLVLLLSACTEDQKSSARVLNPSATASTLLLFLQEKKVEVWSKKYPKAFLYDYQITRSFEQPPIGQFSIVPDSGPQFTSFLPATSEYDLKEVIVFPNDPRPSGQLTPCFACPHTTAAVYAKLEMIIHDYPLTK